MLKIVTVLTNLDVIRRLVINSNLIIDIFKLIDNVNWIMYLR